jgi:hypothetical protein
MLTTGPADGAGGREDAGADAAGAIVGAAVGAAVAAAVALDAGPSDDREHPAAPRPSASAAIAPRSHFPMAGPLTPKTRCVNGRSIDERVRSADRRG